MKSKPETLQNQIIKETFAKNRMSQALSVQKKIGHGWTDRQTDTQIFLLIICRLGLTPVDPSLHQLIAIYAQYMTLAININGVCDGLRPTICSKSAISAKTQHWVLSTAN